MSQGLKIGLTRDLLTSGGEPAFGVGPLEILDGLSWEWLEHSCKEITPEIASRYDALCVGSARVTAASVSGADCRLRILARYGVGYDAVDVPAMTKAGVIVTNTPIAVRRPVATMAMTFVLALGQKLLIKDCLTRAGAWEQRTDHMGLGMTGKTLGLIGAGSTGCDTAELARAFDMTIVAADPYADADRLAALDISLLPLEQLLSTADFVVVSCLLTEETRHLINAARIALMKPTAYLINVARGPIVDEAALIDALQSDRIAGAGLDVFEQEPVDPVNPLLRMNNTIVTPHALCWTDENFDGIARSAFTDIRAVLSGQVPRFVVNPAVMEHEGVKTWALAT
jgi:phosphoglycerate dehydrogenase-like enzyme